MENRAIELYCRINWGLNKKVTSCPPQKMIQEDN